jgi:protein disulfide-isomerase
MATGTQLRREHIDLFAHMYQVGETLLTVQLVLPSNSSHWQALYEFWYPLSPLEGLSKTIKQSDITSAKNLHGYYNFHFAEMNCVTFSERCDKNGVKSCGMSIEGFSSYVEEKFEQVKLDSRPREGVKIPEPGALIVDRTVAPKKPMAKDKDSAAEN